MSAEKEQIKVLKSKRLIDGNGGTPIQNAVMVIEGERIKEVGSEGKVSVPAGAEVIDMGDCTLMPGLIDCVVMNIGMGAEHCKNRRVAADETPPQLQELYGLLNWQIGFENGVTTLLDGRGSGSDMYGEPQTAEGVALRDAINTGLFAGPRALVTGRASITNSHLSRCNSYFREPPDVNADGPWELRKLVRRELRRQCDGIKTTAGGGIGGHGEAIDIRNGTQEELDAIVDECHAFGKFCVCHCQTSQQQRMAVKAKMDALVHIAYTDDETIALIKEANIPIIPTLTHRSNRDIEELAAGGQPEFIIEKRRRTQAICYENFKKIHQAGIKLATGSVHGLDWCAFEMEIEVDLGMTPMEAILTATKNAAETLKLDKITGTLDVGKFADVIAVNGDPLADIRVLRDRQNIRMVMKEGMAWIDKRKGHEKSVVQNWNWKIVD
ncbi:amidohydrolase family protein [Chloroflexota bacterium]